VRVDIEEIRNALQSDVIKREVLEGEKADLARKQIAKVAGRLLRAAKASEVSTPEKATERQSDIRESSSEMEIKEV
jgi:hypothetical protein